MLRREFIRAAGMTLGGVLIAKNLPLAEQIVEEPAPTSTPRRVYHFHGHPRSGCASHPELAPFLEKGISVMPPH